MNPADPELRQGLFQRFLSRLRFPQLFVVFAVLFAFDLIFPDLVPFIDELLLGLATALFASWKGKMKNVTPPRP